MKENKSKIFEGVHIRRSCTLLQEKIGKADSEFLLQLIYWTSKSKREGWVYKSSKEWEAELGFSRATVWCLRGRLKSMHLIEEAYHRPSHRLFFRAVTRNVENLLEEIKKQASQGDREGREKWEPVGAENPDSNSHSVHENGGENVEGACFKVQPGMFQNETSKEQRVQQRVPEETPLPSCKQEGVDSFPGEHQEDPQEDQGPNGGQGEPVGHAVPPGAAQTGGASSGRRSRRWEPAIVEPNEIPVVNRLLALFPDGPKEIPNATMRLLRSRLAEGRITEKLLRQCERYYVSRKDHFKFYRQLDPTSKGPETRPWKSESLHVFLTPGRIQRCTEVFSEFAREDLTDPNSALLGLQQDGVAQTLFALAAFMKRKEEGETLDKADVDYDVCALILAHYDSPYLPEFLDKHKEAVLADLQVHPSIRNIYLDPKYSFLPSPKVLFGYTDEDIVNIQKEYKERHEKEVAYFKSLI